MSGSVVRFEVLGKNGPALRHFCRELFGWKVGRADRVQWFDDGLVEPGYGGITGGIGSGTAAALDHATFFVEVESPGLVAANAKALGGVAGESELADLDTTVAYFADPEDHVVGLSHNAGRGRSRRRGCQPRPELRGRLEHANARVAMPMQRPEAELAHLRELSQFIRAEPSAQGTPFATSATGSYVYEAYIVRAAGEQQV